MTTPMYKVTITPTCVKNHGVENRADYALALIRERIVKSLKAYPDSELEIYYGISESKRRD